MKIDYSVLKNDEWLYNKAIKLDNYRRKKDPHLDLYGLMLYWQRLDEVAMQEGRQILLRRKLL